MDEKSPYYTYWDKNNYRYDDETQFCTFISDIEKILYIPYFNRLSDKTQVYSLISNDDITRRSLHTLFVSHISKTISRGLSLNEDLSQAVSLCHDIGHSPFGHLGERYLDRILFSHCGLHFAHSLQAIRIVEKIFPSNLSLQVLNGVLCHCGKFFDENLKIEFLKSPLNNLKEHSEKFSYFDSVVEQSQKRGISYIETMCADTPEAVVVRISDILAYVGKDREDALRLGYDFSFKPSTFQRSLLRYFINDIIENSVDKPYIAMSKKAYDKLLQIRGENFEKIYSSSDFDRINESVIFPLFENLYEKFLSDLKKKNYDSPIFRHHINYIRWLKSIDSAFLNTEEYKIEDNEFEMNLCVTDFISSMSDNYFISASKFFFPSLAKRIAKVDYFDKFNPNKRREESKMDSLSLLDFFD